MLMKASPKLQHVLCMARIQEPLTGFWLLASGWTRVVDSSFTQSSNAKSSGKALGVLHLAMHKSPRAVLHEAGLYRYACPFNPELPPNP